MVRLATAGKRALVEDLVTEVAWEMEDGYARWLKHSLGIDRVRTRRHANGAL